MGHKNLISDRRFKEQIEIILNRKPTKCWKMKKVRYNREGVESAKTFQEKETGIKLYIYKCFFCKNWHLSSHKN